MHACVLKFLLIFSHMLRSQCVMNKNSDPMEFISESKIEMAPLLISARLDDTIVISAPIVNNALYYLSKPNGDNIKLQLNTSRALTDFKGSLRMDYKSNDIAINYMKGTLKTIISQYNNYLNNVSTCFESGNYYKNDFVIGPITEDDHGNWVLSVYIRDLIEEWIEFFQIISIEVIESIPAQSVKITLNQGENFEVRFKQPIKGLQSCEILAPRSTCDRFYDKDKAYLDYCGFRIPNVTKEDEGEWRIVGVGKIVYTANIYLETN